MANTIAKAIGCDSNRMKETHRLGSKCAIAQANTWRTFAEVFVNADGSGAVSVMRDKKILFEMSFGPEVEDATCVSS